MFVVSRERKLNIKKTGVKEKLNPSYPLRKFGCLYLLVYFLWRHHLPATLPIKARLS